MKWLAYTVTEPADEPVTLVEVKRHVHLSEDVTADDAWINAEIAVARVAAEAATRRALITQTVELCLDAFPSPTNPHLTTVPLSDETGYEIFLPRPPLQSVTSIKYVDDNGAEQTLSAATYLVAVDSEPPRIVPAYGCSWPSTREQPNAVRVRYVCGYGDDAEDVPAPIRAWIRTRVATRRAFKEEMGPAKGDPLRFVDDFLVAYAVAR